MDLKVAAEAVLFAVAALITAVRAFQAEIKGMALALYSALTLALVAFFLEVASKITVK
jgi:hypothetical protein